MLISFNLKDNLFLKLLKYLVKLFIRSITYFDRYLLFWMNTHNILEEEVLIDIYGFVSNLIFYYFI